MNVIEVKDVEKKYSLFQKKTDKLREAFSLRGKSYHEDFSALRGISFSVHKGECVGIIGLNGSGKSTLLKILADIIQPTAGSVFVHGRISALLELGGGFNPEYTGLENIFLNTMLMGMTRKETEEKLEDILDFADIGDFINQPVKIYSSGMYVRLAFAIAVTVEPDILIVDEALSVGDVFFQQKCFRKMRDFIKTSTVLIVSHDMNAITKLCNRCIVLNKGDIVFDGNTKDAVTEYFKIKQGEFTGIREKTDVPLSEKSLYLRPDPGKYSGKMDAVIEEYYYEIDGIAFTEECAPGQTMKVSMKVDASRPIDDLIVGYQVRDKYGNEVFGETSLTSGYGLQKLIQGENRIRFTMVWPEVREGGYFITLGIGEGKAVLEQVEQCWVNQAIHVNYTTYGKLIYGLFNQEMIFFELQNGEEQDA
ncbi:MAG: ABC transporter ATP-binding protein [Clostridiales bacterium]|nr:ABC transporter ATP-binding protein [Clostridiales bacterium]